MLGPYRRWPLGISASRRARRTTRRRRPWTFRGKKAVRHAWVAYIGANRASLRVVVDSSPHDPWMMLGEWAVRHAWVAYIGANRASLRVVVDSSPHDPWTL